jgi:hypothetical protein
MQNWQRELSPSFRVSPNPRETVTGVMIIPGEAEQYKRGAQECQGRKGFAHSFWSFELHHAL